MAHARMRRRPRTGGRPRSLAPIVTRDPLPLYSGRFTAAHAERLLWRAGFGPRAGEAQRLARGGMRAAVLSLTRPGDRSLQGPTPRLERRTDRAV